MKISAVFLEVVRVEAEVLVAPLWEGERPPRGFAGRADWYLAGYLSRLVIDGRLRGRAGEATLVATQGRFLAPRLLLLGLGRRSGFEADGAAGLLRRAAAAVEGMQLGSVALEAPPADARSGLGPPLAQLVDAFAPVLPAAAGEIQILAESEDACDRWRTAIREAFPRGQHGGASGRLAWR